MTGHTGDVDTVDTREVHRGQRLAVDFRIGDEHPFADHRLVLLLEVDVDLGTDEGGDGFLVGFGADDEHLVAQVEDGVAVGNRQLALMYDARYHEVTVQEIVYLQQGLAFQIFVRHLQMHLVGLLVGIGLLLRFQFGLFLLQSHLTYIPY